MFDKKNEKCSSDEATALSTAVANTNNIVVEMKDLGEKNEKNVNSNQTVLTISARAENGKKQSSLCGGNKSEVINHEKRCKRFTVNF